MDSKHRPSPQVQINTPRGPESLEVKRAVQIHGKEYVLVELTHQGNQIEQVFEARNHQVHWIESDTEYEEVFGRLNRE